MVIFILILVISVVVGLQLGIYAVLTQKNVSSVRSIFYSFVIYLMPIVIIRAHIQLFKERHTLLKLIKKDPKYNKVDLNLVSIRLDSKMYMLVSFGAAVLDLFTPKDNIIVFVNAIVEYEKEEFYAKPKVNILEKIGIVGVFSKIIQLITSSMKDYTRETTVEGKMFKRYAH